MNTAIKYDHDPEASVFLKTLRIKVNNYFILNQKSRNGNGLVVFKTIFYLSIFLVSYLLLISNNFLPSIALIFAVICGLSSVFILFNISHDASHNALFSNKRHNKILTYTFNFIGGSGYMWSVTHDTIHHTYPNVINIDADLNQAKPFLRVDPGTKLLRIHRYQHFYAPIIYSTYMIYLTWIKDFQDFGFISKQDSPLLKINHGWNEYFILFLSKAIYFTYVLILPLIILDIKWWKILFGYIIVNILMSFLLLIVQLPLHVNCDSKFAQVQKDNRIHNSWVLHTLENTTDFFAQSKIANFLFGGLNAHSIHHLFDGICHVHYPDLSAILKETAIEFNITYRDISLWQGIKSHFKLLEKLGNEDRN